MFALVSVDLEYRIYLNFVTFWGGEGSQQEITRCYMRKGITNIDFANDILFGWPLVFFEFK